ncbi:efflux transporter periplasmic adaptor subunit [Echinicola strongylocentroti]|uniref:Efflux transporter periplasmic adaptor subunit n=1 Tax=Echinicola strongylocentroti TaxID=1795355 RepID=A0A2Z4IPA0_9BACT|nr:efflux RND transporter periplasmic adaptor subunit [Echinicola strongylocentroti]AWW32961.1 efflux transporter periplasmic adaptor subunit [Echinicola strongylocentroti]
MNNKKTIFISAGILASSALVVFLIFFTEPTAKSEGATKITAMLVSVEEVSSGTFVPEFITTGTVQAVDNISLSAQVSGEVIERMNEFIPGGLVRKGEVLLKINPADYHNQLALRKSELAQAETNLQIEMGRQNIAEQDLALISGDTLSDKEQSLVLRKPQLASIKAQIQSAKAAVDQATLNLQRTVIKAPFDAQVITQNVTLGSQIALGDDLGRLVGTEAYWVQITLPVRDLKWLNFPTGSEEIGDTVKIRNTSSWEPEEYRIGYLYRQIGALDPQTRLARIILRVPDPLGYKSSNYKPQLLIDEFVEVDINGKPIEGVVRLNRDYLRSNETVWVMENEKLSIRHVQIKLMDAHYAYISQGLKDGEKVVTTNISTVTDGVPLRVEQDTTTNTKAP